MPPLEEPLKKREQPATQSAPAPRPWPTAENMLRHNRGPNVGCCSRPTNREMQRRT